MRGGLGLPDSPVLCLEPQIKKTQIKLDFLTDCITKPMNGK